MTRLLVHRVWSICSLLHSRATVISIQNSPNCNADNLKLNAFLPPYLCMFTNKRTESILLYKLSPTMLKTLQIVQ